MGIPTGKGFEDALASLELATEGGRLLIPGYIYRDERGGLATSPPIHITGGDTGPLSLDALLTKTARELAIRGQLESLDATKAVVVAAILSAARPADRLARLNEMIASCSRCSAWQYDILPPVLDINDEGVPPVGEFRFGSFSFSRLRVEKLEYQCRKAGSDYAERMSRSLGGRHGISTLREDVVVVPLSTTEHWAPPREDMDLMYRVTDHYFHGVSIALWGEFWSRFDREQDVLIALGSSFIPSEAWRQLLGRNSVTIFMGIGESSRGWVCPLEAGPPGLNFGLTDRLLPKAEQQLEELGGRALLRGPLGPSLDLYCRFFARGMRHRAAGRHDEGFLHFLISLDLLLGGKDASTASVSARTGALLARGEPRMLMESERQVRQLYDKRSKYVHEGVHVLENDLEAARGVAERVAHALVGAASMAAQKGEPVQWLSRVDLLRATLAVGQCPSDELLRSCGVL